MGRRANTPFKNKPTEGFIRPCRGAQRLLKKLHFFLQALWAETHAGTETMKPSLSQLKSNHIFEGFALLRSLYQHCRDRSAVPSYRPWSASAPLMPCVTEMTQKKKPLEELHLRMDCLRVATS